MAFDVVPTAVTGDIVPAAWGNRVRDNDAYLKGRAGGVSIENSLTATALFAPTLQAGPSASAQVTVLDRGDNTPWVLYAVSQAFRIYSGAVGDVLRFIYSTGQMQWTQVNDPDEGIPPTRLRRVTRAGMLGAGGGTQSLAYNGDGTLFYIFYPDGINATSTITFEYSGGLCVGIRLRIGGSGGTIINSVTFGYSGGQVTSIAQS